jgi:hypothetical protein
VCTWLKKGMKRIRNPSLWTWCSRNNQFILSHLRALNIITFLVWKKEYSWDSKSQYVPDAEGHWSQHDQIEYQRVQT